MGVAYDVRPTTGELEEARAVVEIALDAADRELPEGLQDLRVGLGWMEGPAVTDDFGGAIALCDAPDRVRVLFNAIDDDWTDAVMAATARGAGQAWLRVCLPDERIAFQWQAVLATAAGVSLASRVAPPTPTPWTDKGPLAESWPELEPYLGDSIHSDDVFEDAETPSYPIESLGACLAGVTDLAALPSMTRGDVTTRLAEALAKA